MSQRGETPSTLRQKPLNRNPKNGPTVPWSVRLSGTSMSSFSVLPARWEVERIPAGSPKL